MSEPRILAALPAAGIGRRMGGDTPKQYLPLAGRTVIEHTLTRLSGHPRVAGLAVAIRSGDPWWSRIDAAASRSTLATSTRSSITCDG